MTPEEVYKELMKDMENIGAWWAHQRDKLAKKAWHYTKFPVTTWFEHITPRKNRYLIFSFINGRRYNKNSVLCTMALQKTDNGTAVFFSKMPYQKLASPIALLPHVLDRYDQRCAVKKQGIELIKHYVERNYMGEPVYGEKFSGRSVRYKGRENLCLSVPDGVLLGEIQADGNIFVAHTFITYEDAIGLQRKEFERKKKNLISKEKLIKEANTIYKKL